MILCILPRSQDCRSFNRFRQQGTGTSQGRRAFWWIGRIVNSGAGWGVVDPPLIWIINSRIWLQLVWKQKSRIQLTTQLFEKILDDIYIY